ncbi:MAG: helix-turn-helix domain-containing protein [Anaerolineales bacterium]|nr:helix-turn-helix domain-containing protein [Anaerolineales bacterium]
MDDLLTKLGNNLRQARIERNLSQAELGYRIGIGHSSISLWESGARAPSMLYLYRLCKTLGYSADELLNIRVAPYQEKSRGIEWISSHPDSSSIYFKSNILDGINLFRSIVGEGQNLSQIQKNDELYGYIDQTIISYRINAALLSGSICLIDVKRDEKRENYLKNKYQLLQCIVSKLDDLPAGGNVDEPIRAEAVAFLAAKYCLPFLGGVRSVGFSGGAPIARFFDLIPPFSPEVTGIKWSPLLATERYPTMAPLSNTANGILSQLYYSQPNTVGFVMPFINIERRSDEYFAKSDGHERSELEQARFVKRTASQVNTVFLSVGSPDSDYAFMETGFSFPEFTKAFHGMSDPDKKSCVGDVFLRFLDKDGNRIGSRDDQLKNDAIVYSIELEDLKNMVQSRKLVWVLAARRQKAKIIRALLVSGLANSIVIDNTLADQL